MFATRFFRWPVGATLLLLMASMANAQVQIRVVHAAPFAPTNAGTSVTVTANGDALLEDFRFLDFTEVLEIPAGEYDLAVVPTGADEPAITASVTLEDGVSVTVLAIGDGVNQPLALWPLINDAGAPDQGNLNIRIVHAAPFAVDLAATEVSIRTAGGSVVNGLVGVPYFAESGFFQIPAGIADLKVASNDGRTNLIDPLPVELPAGADVTLIAVGDGVNQPLGILAVPVGPLETRTPVDNSANGWWGVQGNQGLILQPIPAQNRLVGTVYTYDTDGSGQPRWFTLDTCNMTADDPGGCPTPGGFDGRQAMANVFEFTGGTFGGNQPANAALAGQIAIEILDCSNAIAALELESGADLTWHLQRLVNSVDCTLDPRQATFDLKANTNSGAVPDGVEASAIFREWTNDHTLVELILSGGSTATDVSHTAHIHFNSAEEGGGIAFFLGPIDGLEAAPGLSQFLVDQSFDTLIKFNGHINIHESNAALGNIVAQGNIGSNADPLPRIIVGSTAP